MRSARLAATSEHPQVPSWGAPAGPASCPSAPPDFTRGTYIPATAAGAPPGAGGCTILTTFNVNASTFFGENLYMLGNVTELGNWRVSDALPGTAFEYSEERPLWKFEVELPETVRVEYGYVRKRPAGSEGGEVVFESRNRTLTVEACEQGVFGEMAVEDEWVGEV